MAITKALMGTIGAIASLSLGAAVAPGKVQVEWSEAKTVRFDVGGLAPDAEVSVGLEK